MFVEVPLFEARNLPSPEKLLFVSLWRRYSKIVQNERLNSKEASVFLSVIKHNLQLLTKGFVGPVIVFPCFCFLFVLLFSCFFVFVVALRERSRIYFFT